MNNIGKTGGFACLENIHSKWISNMIDGNSAVHGGVIYAYADE